ncbi:MAG: pyridoxamine 5'-phosphate oxidase family protein [Candidatus Marinimicrobia bacterium]|nr:pyridoxamine 5'-phosphate oxidase family protein [Candidatus Neomarinimicrobiota bacterium]MCF7921183.1 pyridoxamine 5'-phosphate oxidase family protein [Candidatus Neomarinimicrobiota bacterium]
MNNLDLITDWKKIRNHFNHSFSSNFHCSVASVDDSGQPLNTPVGSLFLNSDQSGFYFEKYPTKLPKYAKTNPGICILAVNSGTLFWLKSLLRIKFDTYPGVRLYGTLGESRPASEIEARRLRRRMRMTVWLKGNKYLWGDMEKVREIKFTSAEMIHLGEMTKHL